MAIKGRVFDVSTKKEMYGKGTGYNVFAGKDASKGLGEFTNAAGEGTGLAGWRLLHVSTCLSSVSVVRDGLTAGMSSLDPKDAIADYSTLNDAQRKTLDQWEVFFEKVCLYSPDYLFSLPCS